MQAICTGCTFASGQEYITRSLHTVPHGFPVATTRAAASSPERRLALMSSGGAAPGRRRPRAFDRAQATLVHPNRAPSMSSELTESHIFRSRTYPISKSSPTVGHFGGDRQASSTTTSGSRKIHFHLLFSNGITVPRWSLASLVSPCGPSRCFWRNHTNRPRNRSMHLWFRF